MQFKALISFFFAYIAFVQAAPVQIPAGSPVDGLAIPKVAVPNAARDLGTVGIPLPVDRSHPTNKATTLLNAPVARSEVVTHLSEVIPAAEAPLPVDEPVPGLPDTTPVHLKRQDLPGVPAGDAIASQLASGGALAEGLARIGRRQLPGLVSTLLEPVDLNIRQVESPASALPDLPAVPSVDGLVRRQLQTPKVPDASTLDPASVAPIPDLESVSTPTVAEPRQVDIPQPGSAGEHLPPVPNPSALIGRQVDMPPVAVPELDLSSIEGITSANIAEIKRELVPVDALLKSVPPLQARQLAVGEPPSDLPVREVTTPFTPLPTN